MNLVEFTGLPNANELSDSIAAKLIDDYFKRKDLTLDELQAALSPAEAEFIKWLLSLTPADLGINTEFYGFDEPSVETEFKTISQERTVTTFKGKKKTYEEVNFVPMAVYKGWEKLQAAMKSDINKDMIIFSGYRSPAYQMLLISYKLSCNKDEPEGVFRRSSLPGYSQHGLLTNTALDVDVPERLTDHDDPDKLASRDEYKWLLSNANKFGFYLSFPKDNKQGIDFEPWHWQYRG